MNGVSMMSTGAAHQWLLNMEAAGKKLIRAEPRVTTRKIQESLSIETTATMSTVIFVSENDVQGGSPIRWQTSNDGLGLSGASSCCKSSTEAFKIDLGSADGDETWIYRYDPETKMQSTVWLFPDESPPQKLKRSQSAQKKMVAGFFEKSGHVVTIPLKDRRTVTANWYVHHCLPKVFGSLIPAPPKDGTPWHFSSSWQWKCAHSSNNGRLSQWERDATAAAPTVFIRPLSLRLRPIPRSEDITEGYPVWVRRRCMSSVQEGCWRHTQINLGWGVERVVSPHGKVHSCWKKLFF